MWTPKSHNSAPHTCRPPKQPGSGGLWGLHVWGAKLRNCGVHTCRPQRATPATVGAHTCQHQSYVTLPPAHVGTNGRRRGTFGAHTCGPQSYVTLPRARLGAKSFCPPAALRPKVARMPPSALARPQCEPRSPGIHGAHGRGSRSGGRTDSPRVCGGSCGHGSCAEQDGRRNRPRAPQKHRARPKFGLSAAGGQNDFARVPRTGQSYLTLVLARVGTNGRRHGTLGSTRAGGKVT